MIEPTTSGPPAGVPLRTAISRPSSGTVLLEVAGEIDTLTALPLEGALVEMLTDPQDRVLVLDLTGVTFLASSGLAVLIRAAQRAATRDVRLRLVTDSRAVLRPLEITGVDQMFDLHADVRSACHHD